MSEKVNICAYVESQIDQTIVDSILPDIVRIGEDPVLVVPFEGEADKITLHYCTETDIRGYVRCNGEECLLCKLEKRADNRFLFPVYLPVENTIGILPVSTSMKAHSLLPQLSSALSSMSETSEKMLLLTIRRKDYKFYVQTSYLTNEQVNWGPIKDYEEKSKSDSFSLEDAYQQISNENLRMVPEIERVCSLRGIQ